VTRDVDAVFKPHGIVLEEARNVADALGLPYWWLNEQASVYISGKDDASKRRVFDHPGLRVMAASPAHVFAMKARAARTRDIDDLRLLADIIGWIRLTPLCGYARSSTRTSRYPPDRPPCSTSFSADDLLSSPGVAAIWLMRLRSASPLHEGSSVDRASIRRLAGPARRGGSS
jgi:hypothetical protein